MCFSPAPYSSLRNGLGGVFILWSSGPTASLAPGITDQIPAGEVLVAAIDRVAEHAFEREAAHAIEEAAQVGRLIIVDGGEDGVLLVGGQAGEGDALGAEREDIQVGESIEEQRLLGGEIIGQAAVNVIAYTTLDGAGAELVFGDDAVDESVQNFALLRIHRRGQRGSRRAELRRVVWRSAGSGLHRREPYGG